MRSIRWRGSTASDGLATFRFLASTPEREGQIQWKALQTYRDGEIVRWIGAPDSENPASVTTISRDAPRENAGGESAAGATSTSMSTTPTAAQSAAGGDDGPDWLARGLGIAALVVALAGAGVAIARR